MRTSPRQLVLLLLGLGLAACGGPPVGDADASADARAPRSDAAPPDGGPPEGADAIVLTVTSTRSDWSPREVLNDGAVLRWTVAGPGVDERSVDDDAPTFDLSGSSGPVTVTVESADAFAGVTSFQLDDAGVTAIEGASLLSAATTFALRNNPIRSIDVSGLARVDNLTIRSGALEAIDLGALSTLRLLWIYDNALTELDLSANPNLEYVNATGNRLPAEALDRIVMTLDAHGQRDGELLLAGNAGGLTMAAQAAYQSLVEKGWRVDVPAPVPGVRTIEMWKSLLDAEWAGDRADAIAQSTSGNDRQQYYFLFYALEGLVHGWMATGDLALLDDALMLIENTIADAVPVAGNNAGYLGWPSDEARYGARRAAEGTSLWEIYLYRMVGTLLRVMHHSPTLRAMRDYQARYDAILEFTRTHIWEKWVQVDPTGLSQIYRSRTHIASHWARLGMELHLITGERAYLDVFEAISFRGMPSWAGESLRSRLLDNPADPAAFALYQEWESPNMQDTSHGADIISFWATAIENRMYWGQGEHADDAARLVALVDSVIWTSDEPLLHAANWDGTGGSNSTDAGFHGSLTVGRFDPALQNRIETYVSPSTAPLSDTQAMGIGAYNRRILDHGRPVYPERYIPLDGR